MHGILTEIINRSVSSLNLLKPRLYKDPRSKASLRQFLQKEYAVKYNKISLRLTPNKNTIDCYDNAHILLQHLSKGWIQSVDQMPFYKQYIQNLSSELLYFIKKNENKLSKSTQKQVHTLSQWCLYILFLLQERRVIKKLTTTERQCWNIIRFTALLLNKAKETKPPPALAVVPHTEIKDFLTCFFDVIQQPGKLTQQLGNVLHSHQHKSMLGELYTGNIWFRLNRIKPYTIPVFKYQKTYNEKLALLMKKQYSGISVLPDDMLFQITGYLTLQELFQFYIAMYKYLNFSDKEQRKRLQYYHSIQEYQCTWTGTGHAHLVSSAQFSPDSTKIVSASKDQTIKLWDVITGQCIWTGQGHNHNWCVNSVQFSPDGKKIVSASEDDTIKLWDVITGQRIWTRQGHTFSIESAQFSPDGKKIISASSDGSINLWDVITGQCIWTGQRHNWCVNSVQFSPDGTKIVSASDDKTIKLWDVITGQCIWTGQGHTNWVESAQFSPDGKKIISASKDSTVKLWDVITGQCLWTGQGHTLRVKSAQFSPDGSMIVSASVDKTIKLWDATTGECIWTGQGHTSIVKSAQFSPDGSMIVSASSDKTLKLWKFKKIEFKAI